MLKKILKILLLNLGLILIILTFGQKEVHFIYQGF